MRGNEARYQNPGSQLKENDPMESRIAVLENDMRNLKENVAKLFHGLKVANETLAILLTGQAELRGEVKTLRAEMGTLRAELMGGMAALEAKMMRWFIATTFSSVALAFSVTKLFS